MSPKDRDPSSDLDETLESESAPLEDGGQATTPPRGPRPEAKDARSTGKHARSTGKRRHGVPVRRHPDIDVARLLVKRGLIAKGPAVEALRTQKARAKTGKNRVPFLLLLVKTGVLAPARLSEAQDEIRKNTYICEACDARAVILAGSQSRGGTCPRCGHEISADPQTDPQAVPAREFQGTDESATAAYRGPAGLIGLDPSKRLAPGQVVFEKYLLEDELGRGAMGIVFRARHIGLNKDVALKVLIPTDDNREHQIARFRREAAAVQKLRHPAIIPVHDFGGDGELYYLTMELVEGGESLHRALKRRDKPMPLRPRLELLAQVAHAVGHAHERGVVHRDLKPANVLIDPRGAPFVADFGLAKDEDDEAAELTRTQDRLGTPLFMAPEQIRRGASQVDGRADVWALGVMLFVCVTGRYPFRSRTVMDLYLRIMKDEPDWSGTRYSAPDRPGIGPPTGAAPPHKSSATLEGATSKDRGEATEVDANRVQKDGSLPKTLHMAADVEAERPEVFTPPPFAAPPELAGREVPRDLRRIIECALAKHPDDRYPTAEELALDLERFLAERPVEARTASLLTRMRRALLRRRVIWRIAYAAMVAAAVTLGVAVALGVRRERDRERRQQIDALWASTGGRQAYDEFEKRLALEPALAEHPEALLHQGEARARLLRWEEAWASLDAAAAAAAGDDLLKSRVAAERAHLALISGDHVAAYTYALEALRAELPDPRPALYAGFAALALNDPERLARADEVVALAAARPGAPPQLAACHVRLALARGDLQGARQRLPAAPKAGEPPEWFDVTLARAAVALAARELDAAEGYFGVVRERFVFKVLRDRDAEASYYNSQGYVQLMDRKLGAGLVADRAAAALSPWHPGPVYYAARLVLGGYADPLAALPWLEKTLARDPFHPAARDLLLAVLTGGPVPDLPRAARALEEARALRPASAEPPLRLAALHLLAGRAREAWDAVDEAARLEPRRHAGAVAALRAAALRRAAGAERDELTRRAAGATFEPRDRVESALEAALRVELARADLAAGDARAALEEVRPVLQADLDNPVFSRALDSALVLGARALAALGEREQALELLATLTPWVDRQLRSLPPEATPEGLRGAPELQPLRGEKAFQALLEELELRRKLPQ